MRTLFNATPEKAGGGKRLVTVADGGHNDTWERGGKKYLDAIDTFIKEVKDEVVFSIRKWHLFIFANGQTVSRHAKLITQIVQTSFRILDQVFSLLLTLMLLLY